MIRADTTAWFSDQITASRYYGFGVLGSAVPAVGSDGSGLLAQAVVDNSWENDELRLEPEYGPTTGAVLLYEDTSAVRAGAPLGNSTTTYRIYRNNAYEGVLTVVWENGILPFTQAPGTIRADSTPWASDANIASLYPGYGVIGSDIPTAGTDGAGLLAEAVLANGWENDELRLTPLVGPSSGSIELRENTSAIFTSPPPGPSSTTYTIFRNELTEGVLTVNWINGDVESPVLTPPITVSSLTGTSYTITWSAGSDNVGITEYFYRLNGGAWQSTGLALTANISGRTPATIDTIEVRAADAVGNFSNILSTTANLLDTIAPVLSGAVSIADLTTTSYTASWPLATDNVGVVQYQYRLNGGAWTATGISTSASITGRTPGSTDLIEVRARDAANNFSAIISGDAELQTLDDTGPAMVPPLVVTALTPYQYTVNWTAASDNVGVTEYWFRVNSGTWTNVGLVLSITLTGRTPETTDIVDVRAGDAAGNFSNVLSTSVLLPSEGTVIYNLTATQHSSRIRLEVNGVNTVQVRVGNPVETWPDGCYIEIVSLSNGPDIIIEPFNGSVTLNVLSTDTLKPGQHARVSRVAANVWDLHVYSVSDSLNTLRDYGGSGTPPTSSVLTYNGTAWVPSLTPLYWEKQLSCSDLTTNLTATTNVGYFRVPYAINNLSVRASLLTAASSGTVTADINKNGSTILSTKLTVDALEKTSLTAAVPAVLTSTTLAVDDEITIDIDVAGTGARGLILTFTGILA